MAPEDRILLYRRSPRDLRRRELRLFAERLREEVAEGRGFHCLVTDDRELLRMNRQFLNQDYATDVLAFPESGPDGYLGELAISVERAQAQADEHGHSREQEIQILMLHGLLHLMGMDHHGDRGRMRRAETRWRRHFGLPAGLIERAAR